MEKEFVKEQVVGINWMVTDNLIRFTKLAEKESIKGDSTAYREIVLMMKNLKDRLENLDRYLKE